MDAKLFRAIAAVYFLLLVVTGGFAFFAVGGSAMPPPDQLDRLLQAAVSDPELKAHFMNDLTSILERASKLSESATNAFQVVLGALIGFLTAAGAALKKND